MVYFGKPVSRAWIQSSSVEAFTEGSNPPEPMEVCMYVLKYNSCISKLISYYRSLVRFM